MADVKDKVLARIKVLQESLVRIQNNANAHLGAIQELEKVLKELEDGVSISDKARSDTADVSDSIG